MSDANHLLENLLGKLMSDDNAALSYSQGPAEYLATEVGDADLAQANLGDVISNATNSLSLAPETTETIFAAAPATAAPAAAPAGASGGGAAPAPAAAAPVTLQDVEQNFTSVLTEVHGGNTEFTENIVDNGTEFDIELDDIEVGPHGEVDLEIDNEVTNANALGEGSVAAGEDATGVATGDGAIATGGNVYDSQQNSGDDALQIAGNNDGVAIAGGNSGIAANGSVDDAIIGNDNTQVGQADVVVSGDNNAVTNVEGYDNNVGSNITEVNTGGYYSGGDAVVGNNNATIQGSSDVNASFGSGDVVDVSGASFDNSNVNFGDGGVVQDNDTTTESTISGSFNQDNDVEVYTEIDTDVTLDQSINDSSNFTDKSDNEFDESFNTIDTEIDADDHATVEDVEIID